MKKELKNPKEEIEILIVEDSPLQAEILKSILEQHHYRHIVVANDGKEALALINKHKPTILISDIIMPEMDGYQLCRYIKADANLKDIPVILLTTLSNSKDVIKALECGANRFITKPYDEDYLLSNIQSILANRQLWKTDKVPMGVNIFFSGERYFITADPQQILDLLLSTYETAVRKNLELIQAQAELEAMNERLEEKVKERTAALIAEIAERKKVEEQLRKLSQAIEQSPSIVLILDTEGRIEYVNPNFSFA
jgi:CheY-like chemotaxis protein